MYEALEPSTGTYNCPVPAGPCPNMYRFVGNDPGQPGDLNPDYNPRFRTIATNFQGWPGLYTVTDTAPDPGRRDRARPGHHRRQPDAVRPRRRPTRSCSPWTSPYVRPTGTRDRTVTVTGTGFGATRAPAPSR